MCVRKTLSVCPMKNLCFPEETVMLMIMAWQGYTTSSPSELHTAWERDNLKESTVNVPYDIHDSETINHEINFQKFVVDTNATHKVSHSQTQELYFGYVCEDYQLSRSLQNVLVDWFRSDRCVFPVSSESHIHLARINLLEHWVMIKEIINNYYIL